MSLPRLISYDAPVPPGLDLPVNRAPWVLEASRSAVLVHDLQRYFLRPYAADCPALDATLRRTSQILTAARSSGIPVFYTAQDGEHRDRGLQGDLWGAGMTPAAEDTSVVPQVAPGPRDTMLRKHRYTAFAATDLADRLAREGRDQLVITGVYAHIGVMATAFDAFCRDVQPFVVADAVADFGRDQHLRALDLIASCCGVVTLAEDVIDRLTAGQRAGSWTQVVDDALARVLPSDVVRSALADERADLFGLGLNSLQAFDILDELAEQGVDIDFGDFTRSATVAFLREQGAVAAR